MENSWCRRYCSSLIFDGTFTSKRFRRRCLISSSSSSSSSAIYICCSNFSSYIREGGGGGGGKIGVNLFCWMLQKKVFLFFSEKNIFQQKNEFQFFYIFFRGKCTTWDYSNSKCAATFSFLYTGEVRGEGGVVFFRCVNSDLFEEEEEETLSSPSRKPLPPLSLSLSTSAKGHWQEGGKNLTTHDEKERDTKSLSRKKEDENRAALFTSQFSPTRKWGKDCS